MQVKHKPMRRSVIVEYDPRKELLRRLGLAAVVLVALLTGVVLGGYFSDPGTDERSTIPNRVASQSVGLEQQLINAQTAAEIDRRALESCAAGTGCPARRIG